MPRTPATRAHVAIRSALVALVVLGIGVICVSVTLAQGAKNDRHMNDRLVGSQRAGCERSKLDRGDNANVADLNADFMDQAAIARARSGDLDVAAAYREGAVRMRQIAVSIRGRIVDCAVAFPR